MKHFLLIIFLLIALTAVGRCQTALPEQKYLDLSEKFRKEGDFREASRMLNEAAFIRWNLKDYDGAIRYYQNSLKLNEGLKNEQGVNGIYSNLAMLHYDKQDYIKSLEYFNKTLGGRVASKNVPGIVSGRINLSVVLNKLKKHNEAAVQLEEALRLSTETNDRASMSSCYSLLAETYDMAGDAANAQKYFLLFKAFHDADNREKLLNAKDEAERNRLRAEIEAGQKKIKELEVGKLKEQVEDKSAELGIAGEAITEISSDLASKRKENLELNLKRQTDAKIIKLKDEQLFLERLLLIFSILAAVGMLGFSVFAFRNARTRKRMNRQLRVQKGEILHQKDELMQLYNQLSARNRDITDSIEYARRFQLSVLPASEGLNLIFKESFLFSEPKEIVSGDFFWWHSIKDICVIAVGDCTGHGVPGALISVMAVSGLRQAVNELAILEPDAILLFLDKYMRESMYPEAGERLASDGLDCALAVIHSKTGQIKWASARRPVITVRNGISEIVSGSKFSICESATRPIFKLHEWKMNKGDAIYFFSDGITDQFGGRMKERYKLLGLKDFIDRNSEHPAQLQRENFIREMKEWSGNYAQMDDMILLGIKF